MKREEIRDYPTLKIPFMKSEARIKWWQWQNDSSCALTTSRDAAAVAILGLQKHRTHTAKKTKKKFTGALV
jgi:hypothetical protein